ncbi:MAG: TlpA disulfide reductase family protein [Bacteroidota bacterium]
MKKITFLISFIFLTLSVSAQKQNPLENSITAFNGFQRTKAAYPDSAIRYLQNLAVLNPHSMEDLLHNSFSQSFLNFFQEKMTSDTAFLAMLKQRNITIDSVLSKLKLEKKSANIILSKLSNDPSLFIKNNIYPIAEWADAQNNKKNPDKLLEIANRYLEYLAGSNDVYAQRKARYGLLISQLMVSHEKLKPTSDKIIQLIYKQLQDQQMIENLSESKLPDIEKRAWYRYMFAYTNFISAQNASHNKGRKLEYLKLAYQYSPDNLDKTVSHAYFYDMIFLIGEEKKSFEEEYLAELGSDDEKLKILVAMSMNDPSFKAKAKTLYKGNTNFNEYWLSEFNKNFKTAPFFSLLEIDGKPYTLSSKKNQWTLIDFWGTWCAPCRKEHPALQKLYQRIKDGKIPNLNIITIAKDNQPNVKRYMQEFNYSFPVAMSDNEIEKSYKVSSWPSKFLISPQGKFVIIPFNVNWEKYIEEYTN